ncbi:MAG: radical SAM protein [Desulfamplus sp.]|nr:radical SAM protein [Desulfamplus sp.]
MSILIKKDIYMNIYIETLGCCRNQVDSEVMMGRLQSRGHDICNDPSEAEVIIVNTCGFIEAASAEAVDTILAMSGYKSDVGGHGICRHLVVAGCLPERFRDDTLAEALPEVDVFLGTGACDLIVEAVEGIGKQSGSSPMIMMPDPCARDFQGYPLPRKLTLGHTAYVKISEGCNRHCTYCIIPRLRGRQRSRPMEDVVAETRHLLETGVKEIVLVGENTTDYGIDLDSGISLAPLLLELSGSVDEYHEKSQSNRDRQSNKVESIRYQSNRYQPNRYHSNQCQAKRSHVPWLRLLYTHPASITRDMVETISARDNICPYFDIPIQHASSKVLKRMGRNYDIDHLHRLFSMIREIYPEAALRTTVITGFPGETEADFKTLVEFLQEIRFDHLGVFPYSDSEDLRSHHLKGHLPPLVGEERHDLIMNMQAEISGQKLEHWIGKTVTVLVEENPDEGIYLGRTRFQAPEVDGITFIYASGLEIGEFADINITETHEYDLTGEKVIKG